MRLEDKTYAVVSYEEMMERKRNLEEEARKFRSIYKDFLITCLCEMGFWNNRVRYKETGVEGILAIDEKTYYRPYEIKFYPFTKSGNISKSPRYFLYSSDKAIVQDLTKKFELVGESNAG